MKPALIADPPRPTVALAIVVLALGLSAAGAWWLFSRHTPEVQYRSRFLLNTVCSLQVPGGPEWLPILDRILDETARLNAVFNPYQPDSPLDAFNARQAPLTDPEIVAVTEAALQVSRESEGAFDVTIFPLVRLWRAARQAGRPPSDSEISRAKSQVDYRCLLADGGRVRKTRPEVQMDLGGIAKGYAAGLAAKRLRAAGAKAGVVDFGGNLVVIGAKGRRPWQVGVKDPRGAGLIGVLELRDAAVSTSGDYQRYFEAQGVRYHHLLDPRTGWPARSMRSVTVVAKDPVLADAWSTAFFILGPEWTDAYCRNHPELQALWVDAQGRIGVTPGLRSSFRPQTGHAPPQP